MHAASRPGDHVSLEHQAKQPRSNQPFSLRHARMRLLDPNPPGGVNIICAKLSSRIQASQMFCTASDEDRRGRSVHCTQRAGQIGEYTLAIFHCGISCRDREVRANGTVRWEPAFGQNTACGGGRNGTCKCKIPPCALPQPI